MFTSGEGKDYEPKSRIWFRARQFPVGDEAHELGYSNMFIDYVWKQSKMETFNHKKLSMMVTLCALIDAAYNPLRPSFGNCRFESLAGKNGFTKPSVYTELYDGRPLAWLKPKNFPNGD